jgi:hydrogenase maturation protein HypF
MMAVLPLAFDATSSDEVVEARQWHLFGRIQGVGFRPHVFRLAAKHQVQGWVCNRGGGVEIRAEGTAHNLDLLWSALDSGLPPGAEVFERLENSVPLEGFESFSIHPSRDQEVSSFFPPVDIGVCAECLSELDDPKARRFRYPFINCAYCGPRYTVLQSMPYDRHRTTMSDFALCAACLFEYLDPDDRRHHAQPLACARCGPSLTWRQGTHLMEGNEESLAGASEALRRGLTVAVRGVGGYHLLCDAGSSSAVAALRLAKRRPSKPLAVLVPLSGPSGLDFARTVATLSLADEVALLAPERPIVIVQRLANSHIVEGVAPDLNEIGLMLPYSPLLCLLLDDFGGALVATSGNIADEPIVSDLNEAEARLGKIASGFLHHNRGIARAADDSVVRRVAGQARPIRLGRGNGPLEFFLPKPIAVPTLALGALQKNTIALAFGHRVAISPHIGDFISARGRDALLRTIGEFESLYKVAAEQIALDAHPSIQSRQLGSYGLLPIREIGHHVAHASAVAGEFSGKEPMLCFTWDANGFAPGGSSWGGEALLGQPGAWRRVGSFRRFRLPGGEMAAHQPWRSALGMCWEAQLVWPDGKKFSMPDLRAAYQHRINCPQTSAVGRIFDAAAALLGLSTTTTFSAQAAMRLEAACPPHSNPEAAIQLPMALDDDQVLRADWQPLLEQMLDHRRSVASRAEMFHASLAQALCEQASWIKARNDVSIIGLAGGCFQNRVLTEMVTEGLLKRGFHVCLPQRLPVNDASISFGQVVEVAAYPAPSPPAGRPTLLASDSI